MEQTTNSLLRTFSLDLNDNQGFTPEYQYLPTQTTTAARGFFLLSKFNSPPGQRRAIYQLLWQVEILEKQTFQNSNALGFVKKKQLMM